ncbi:membrane progestin receptor gamma-B-like isoform X3 [Hippocampus zosterae]|uniref:membrane progestin receptor gamma-B-like isoform X3 n=1 Tax=Hippocampus zosterae TaxID=109293 RepID=UPI00223CED08|nr:membrane progestin receptor gamma-B-like isoform X3 [Hippocampus zosterae]
MLSLMKLPRVVTINQVPKVFHEHSIISGYRYHHSSATDCILSLFQLTNETINIWTHFLPTWYCYFVFSLCVPRQVGKPLLPPVLCPCCSSELHRMHWLGVLLQVWLGLPFRHHNQDVLKRFPKCHSPRFSKVLRLVAFAYPYLFDHIPLFYRLFLCEGEGCTDNDANVLHYTHIALAFLTGFLFATHLPERLAPGSFDFIGNSHQLFHVFGILGTRFQMMAVEQDMVLRRPWLLDHSLPITFANSLGVTLLCLMVNLSILLLFSLPLLSAKVGQQKKHKRRIKAH